MQKTHIQTGTHWHTQIPIVESKVCRRPIEWNMVFRIQSNRALNSKSLEDKQGAVFWNVAEKGENTLIKILKGKKTYKFQQAAISII